MSETVPPTGKNRRVLLKLSGESLMGDKDYGIDDSVVDTYAKQIVAVAKSGIEIAVVLGGGNIYRGIQAKPQGGDRVQGDHMGMLATMINSLALQSAIEAMDYETRLMSAINMQQIAEMYVRRRAIRHLEKGRIVIFGCGMGQPFFTTDSAAAERAIEINADLVLKGTRVDGIYTADPLKDKSAQRFSVISPTTVHQRGYQVMDMTAFTICREHRMPIVVFDMNTIGNLAKVLDGTPGIGTLVDPDHEGEPLMASEAMVA